MSEGLVTAAYIGAIILFILTLGGLSNQETARKGNYYGMAGMTLAILATVFGPGVTENIHLIIITMLVGGTIGLILAKKVEMTQMPELVAILHSLVGKYIVITEEKRACHFFFHRHLVFTLKFRVGLIK